MSGRLLVIGFLAFLALFVAALHILLNTLADIVTVLVNPRLRVPAR